MHVPYVQTIIGVNQQVQRVQMSLYYFFHLAIVFDYFLNDNLVGVMNEWYLGSSSSGPNAPRTQVRPFVPHVLLLNSRSRVPLANFQMAPIHIFLISSGSKKKEPGYECLSESRALHAHKMWTEVSSSVPHFLQMDLLLCPIIYKCLLKALCPVSKPITTLDCVLLKDNNRALVARSGPEINS